MLKAKYKGRCEKVKLKKSKEVGRFYCSIQAAYASILDEMPGIVEIFCNFPMTDLELGQYTSDFYCKKNDGSGMVRECVFKRYLTKPKTVMELEASRVYWQRHGVDDWGIVVEISNEEVSNHVEEKRFN